LLPNRWFLIGLFLAALAVRLYFAHSLYLNPDECLHVNAGSSGQWAVYHHPPLLFWWLWIATLVSNQEWWLRLAPVVAGALTPLAAGLWLCRWLHPVTAWGLAALLAFTPNLVLLSVQLRGYSMALLGIAIALYALDRALAESSRRWLLIHFAALVIAILAEFMTAWIALAMGLYGLLRLAREREIRSLLPVWLAGQSGCAGLYAVLYVFIIRPLVDRTNAPQLIQTYLSGAFPQAGENLLVFTAVGSSKQIVYLTGSLAGGVLAACFLFIGLGLWLRQRDSRALLVISLCLATAGAIAGFYPFGRTRHTVAIGMVCLSAIGIGIDILGKRWKTVRWAAPATLLAISFLVPWPDIHNIAIERWSNHRWRHSLTELQRLVPPGATILADDEALQMLQAYLAPRNDRFRTTDQPNSLALGNFTVKSIEWEWRRVCTEWVAQQSATATGSVWVVDSGFDIWAAKRRATEAGAEAMIDEPGVLFLARLRR